MADAFYVALERAGLSVVRSDGGPRNNPVERIPILKMGEFLLVSIQSICMIVLRSLCRTILRNIS